MHVTALEQFLGKANYAGEAVRLRIVERLQNAQEMLAKINAPEYVAGLRGTIGVQPLAKS